MAITAALFADAGRALFGEEWQNPTAALLDMNPRTVRRIAKAARDGDEYRVNQSLGPVLAEHLRARAADAMAESKEAARLAELLGT